MVAQTATLTAAPAFVFQSPPASGARMLLSLSIQRRQLQNPTCLFVQKTLWIVAAAYVFLNPRVLIAESIKPFHPVAQYFDTPGSRWQQVCSG